MVTLNSHEQCACVQENYKRFGQDLLKLDFGIVLVCARGFALIYILKICHHFTLVSLDITFNQLLINTNDTLQMIASK